MTDVHESRDAMLGGAQAGAPQAAAPELRVAASWEEMISLRDAWTGLADSVGADGFSRPEYCIPVGYEVGESAAMVFQAWVDGTLVAVLPVFQGRTRGLSVFRPLGTSAAASAAPLVSATGHEAFAALAAHLVTGRQALHLPRASAEVRDALAGVGTQRVRPAAAGHELPAGSITSMASMGPTSSMTSRESVAGGPVQQTVRILDDPDAVSAAAGLLLDGVGPRSVLLATVLDALLRGGRGFVVSDDGRGSAAWVTGGGTASLWWARGSCAPVGPAWADQLAAAGGYAAEHGFSRCVLPPAAGSFGAAGTDLTDAVRRPVSDVLAAAGRPVLTAADRFGTTPPEELFA